MRKAYVSIGTVSIHAPAWGATAVACLGGGLPACFNPRPRVGGDGNSNGTARGVIRFNPRPRVGGDMSLEV